MNEIDDTRLNEYLDGTLDAATRQAVEAQLKQSPAAQAQLAELQALFAAFATVEDLPLTTDLSPLIAATIRARATPWWLRFLPLAQVLTAVALMLIFWRTLQTGWQRGWAMLLHAWPSIQLPALAVEETVSSWVTAVWQNAHITPPQIELATYQWGLIVSLALIIWLGGNRLLFANPNGGSHG